jgi:DHA1 family bicyclomycin/chloramphenicol resistance-like MFS transporter
VLIVGADRWCYRETLLPARRTSGGFARTTRDFRALLSDRRYTAVVLSQGFAYAALFAYLSGATYVLQGVYGLTPQQYALAFGINSAAFMSFGFLAGRACERFGPWATLHAGLVMCCAGGLGLLVVGLFDLSLLIVVVSLLLLVGGVAVTTPPATTLALADRPEIAGTASSLLGMARFAFGGVSAPLVGLGGAGVLPWAVVTVVALGLAVAALSVPGRRGSHVLPVIADPVVS